MNTLVIGQHFETVTFYVLLLSRVKTSDSIVLLTNAQFLQGKCGSEPIELQKNNSNHVIALAGNLSWIAKVNAVTRRSYSMSRAGIFFI